MVVVCSKSLSMWSASKHSGEYNFFFSFFWLLAVFLGRPFVTFSLTFFMFHYSSSFFFFLSRSPPLSPWSLTSLSPTNSPDYGMFKVTVDNGLLYPNPASDLVSSSHLEMFEFMGRLLGKALYESTLVEPVFAQFFLNKLLDNPNYVDDLRSLDFDLHRNLLSITQLDDVSGLDLTFSVIEDRLGAQTDVPLVANGQDKLVDNTNRRLYIASMAYYYLHERIRAQSSAFRRGLNKLVPVGWIRMFNSSELQLLIGGSSTNFDVNDMKRHSNCSAGYHPDQPYIQSFWTLIDEFNDVDRAKFLTFVTACSRPPLLGFRKLHPKFCIQQIRIEKDSDRLPIAATCMNLLKLPKYSSIDVLREKLLMAINEGQGFTLS